MPARSAIRRPFAPARGFTLTEALIALTLTSLAGAVVMLSVESSVRTSRHSLEGALAQGIAEQLIDEVLATRYMAAGASPRRYPLGPNNWETAGAGRSRYDDTDDFYRYSALGPRDRFGRRLGEGDDAGGLRHPALSIRPPMLDRWRERIEVYYVSATNPSQRLAGSATSNVRAVEVTIEAMEGSVPRRLASVRRVFAYVPPP